MRKRLSVYCIVFLFCFVANVFIKFQSETQKLFSYACIIVSIKDSNYFLFLLKEFIRSSLIDFKFWYFLRVYGLVSSTLINVCSTIRKWILNLSISQILKSILLFFKTPKIYLRKKISFNNRKHLRTRNWHITDIIQL